MHVYCVEHISVETGCHVLLGLTRSHLDYINYRNLFFVFLCKIFLCEKIYHVVCKLTALLEYVDLSKFLCKNFFLFYYKMKGLYN